MFAHIAAILRKHGREILILFGSKFTNEPFSHGLRQHNTAYLSKSCGERRVGIAVEPAIITHVEF